MLPHASACAVLHLLLSGRGEVICFWNPGGNSQAVNMVYISASKELGQESMLYVLYQGLTNFTMRPTGSHLFQLALYRYRFAPICLLFSKGSLVVRDGSDKRDSKKRQIGALRVMLPSGSRRPYGYSRNPA